MSWQTPTADDVLSEFTPTEVATITNLMGGSSVLTSKLDAIMTRTIQEIRGYIRSGAYEVDSSSNTTLPLSLITDAIAITRWRFLISAPQLRQLQTQERQNAILASIVKLQAVAQQQFTPDDPGAETATPSGLWNSENKVIMRTHPVPKPATQWTPQTDAYANPNAPQDAQST